jgi:hypothetical protein
MTNVVHFFDPTPLRGTFCETPTDTTWTYPAATPPGAHTAELLDARLAASGTIMVGLQSEEGDESPKWCALEDIVEGSDGAMGLRLAGGDCLIFPPAERERVSNIFLKLSTRHY